MSKKTFKYYFDYAAAAPLDPKVKEAMEPYGHDRFGNPSSLHRFGCQTKMAVEKARRDAASVLFCRPDEFIFTASATEANNLAFLGIAHANRRQGKKVIISAVEHASVMSIAKALEREGFEVIKLKVSPTGLVNPSDLMRLLSKEVILVSVVYADSETGTIQPLSELAKVVSRFRRQQRQSYPFFHTDASQAASSMPLDVRKTEVDMMTLSSYKIYGPMGMGGLYVKRGTVISPLIIGGGQQNNLRAGTENVPGIIGFVKALVLNEKSKKKEGKRLEKLRNQLEKSIFQKIPKVILNGHLEKRLPHFLNISFLDIEGEAALLYLDQKGIAVGTGSACSSQSLEPSHIIAALGRPYEYIHGSLRFTLGKYTTRESVDYVLRHLPPIIAKLRKISPLNLPVNRLSSNRPALSKAFVGGQTPHFLRKRNSLLP